MHGARLQEANDAIGAINVAVMHLEASVAARRAVGSSEALGELFNDIEAQVRQDLLFAGPELSLHPYLCLLAAASALPCCINMSMLRLC